MDRWLCSGNSQNLSKTNDLNSCMHVQCNREKNINMTMSLAVVSIFPRNREAEVRFCVDNSVFFSLIFLHHFFALLSLKLYNIPLIQLRNLRFVFFMALFTFVFFKVHFSDFF